MGEASSAREPRRAVVEDTRTMIPTITTDVLIVGTGPAGASLAAFLASLGVQGLVIGATSSTAATPRAHYTNVATMECLRDVGLEAECVQAGTSGDHYRHWRWCDSLAGAEYARTYSYGNDPRRRGEYETASPCRPQDLVQTLAEPILLRHATQHGFQCRFDTRLLGFEDNNNNNNDGGKVTSMALDVLTGHKVRIVSRYLAGADGARSQVVRHLGLAMTHGTRATGGGGGVATNVLVEADLAHLMRHNRGLLHGITRPGEEADEYAWIGIARMIKPWHEWQFSYFAKPGVTEVKASKEDWYRVTKKFIGDDAVDVKVKSVSFWKVNESYAETYSKGNVFCLGDAVHRHPPQNGLGSNTCIQDSYNLAWKLALVLQQKASPHLLSTYSTERQPVGKFIVTRANDSFLLQLAIWQTLGVTEPSLAARQAILAEFKAASPAGRARRAAFQKAVEDTKYEHHALGAEMNQQYTSSAVFLDDEKEGPPEYETYDDRMLHYKPSTYPGCRLPHAWLNRVVPTKPTSTHDLAGKGAFAIITGIGGKEVWSAAAEKVRQALGMSVAVTSVGWRQDFEDPFFDWERVKGVEDSGAVLIRPDRTVAWRCRETGNGEEDKLELVLKKVLGLDV